VVYKNSNLDTVFIQFLNTTQTFQNLCSLCSMCGLQVFEKLQQASFPFEADSLELFL
jgi:hypothetical protein